VTQGNRTAGTGLGVTTPTPVEAQGVESRLRTLLELALAIGRREGLLGNRQALDSGICRSCDDMHREVAPADGQSFPAKGNSGESSPHINQGWEGSIDGEA